MFVTVASQLESEGPAAAADNVATDPVSSIDSLQSSRAFTGVEPKRYSRPAVLYGDKYVVRLSAVLFPSRKQRA